ncbi:MAG: DNA-directed RNA polymerase subunit alpha [Mariprofundaceae bacterium]
MDLIKPRNVTVEESVPDRVAKIVFEPLERGYGITLGNSLRRVLLASLSGGAITAVRFGGVLHEFDTIKGVREDVMDIILSLKEVDLCVESGEETTLKLDVKGPAVVTAGKMAGQNVRVLNPDMVIAHLNEDGHLKLEATVKLGRGYVPASEQDSEDKPVGTLLVDASYSPVRQVALRVENARVGQRTNYDKLIIEIETNSALSPEEAIGQAASIIQDQLAVFADFKVLDEGPAPPVEDKDIESMLGRPIEHLDLSVRSMNCLKSDNIFYVGDLVQRSEQEMLRTPNFGRKSLTEIREVLHNMGLTLGMQVGDWQPEDAGKETEELGS